MFNGLVRSDSKVILKRVLPLLQTNIYGTILSVYSYSTRLRSSIFSNTTIVDLIGIS